MNDLFHKNTLYVDSFINNYDLLRDLIHKVEWDESISARKTASFGKPYNYSQIEYPYQEFTDELQVILQQVTDFIGFEPNNCLINYYTDGNSKMGYHSDQTDILEEGTGVVIISLGEPRVLRFRNIENKEDKYEYVLESGSLFYMTSDLQKDYQHSIPKTNTDNHILSLTFRKLI